MRRAAHHLPHLPTVITRLQQRQRRRDVNVVDQASEAGVAPSEHDLCSLVFDL